jgi:serine/threonine-protein kinase haspin
MPPLRKYGTKRSTSSAVSSNIFGRSHPAAAGPSSDTAPLPIPSRPAAPAPRDPLSELSSNFGALALKERGKPEYTLLPLATFQLFPKSWGTVFSSADTLEKIAEASFAEVFRCSNASGTSILKVMQLKVSTNPASLEDVHASSAEMVVSELQVMDVLTEVPGFVQLKEFHLIKGNPGAHFKKAWDAFSKLRPTEYPNPDDYTSQSVFLVIELGDAGEVLENKPMKQLEQVWDVLLQVIIALARAEATNEFEVYSHSHPSSESCSQLHSIVISTRTTSAFFKPQILVSPPSTPASMATSSLASPGSRSH